MRRWLTRKKWLRNKIKSFFDLYDIDELVVGGNCGCCGAVIRDILPAIWPWGLCEQCKETP